MLNAAFHLKNFHPFYYINRKSGLDRVEQYALIFGKKSLYLSNPDKLIEEIEHAIEEYHINPRQGCFLLELASLTGEKLTQDLNNVQSMQLKDACKYLANIRELSCVCCNLLNHITTAADNSMIMNRNLAWAPYEALENIRDLKESVFSLFGSVSKFADNPYKFDWYNFSALVAKITSCFEVVRRDSEKQKCRMNFYLKLRE